MRPHRTAIADRFIVARRYMERGIALPDALIALGISAIVAVGVTIFGLEMTKLIIPRLQIWHAQTAFSAWYDHTRSDATSSDSVFTPKVDVTGAQNCNGPTDAGAVSAWCHEVDIMTQLNGAVDKFDAYLYNSATGMTQHYTYTTPNNGGGGSAPMGVVADGNPMAFATFKCRPIKASQFASDSTASMFLGNIATLGADTSVQTRYAGITQNNAVVFCWVGTKYETSPLVLASLDVPSVGINLDVGANSPTPTPALAITNSLVYPLPGATQVLTNGVGPGYSPSYLDVTEANYHDFYKIANTGTCTFASWVKPNTYEGAPYTGQYLDPSHPTPPTPGPAQIYAYPYAGPPSNNNDGPAHQAGSAKFDNSSTGGTAGGECGAVVTDVYGNTASTTVQVMGPLDLSTGGTVQGSSVSLSWGDPQNQAPQKVGVGKLWDNIALAPIVEAKSTCAGIATITDIGDQSPPTNPSGSTESNDHFWIQPVQDANGNNIGGSCDFYINDQYKSQGEADVDISINQVGAMDIEPKGTQYPLAPATHVTGCTAAKPALAYDDTSMTVAASAATRAAIGANASGCYSGNPVVTQPGSTAAFSVPQTGSANSCESKYGFTIGPFAGSGNAPGPIALQVQPGSSATSSCSISVKGAAGASRGTVYGEILDPTAYAITDALYDSGAGTYLNIQAALTAAENAGDCQDPQSDQDGICTVEYGIAPACTGFFRPTVCAALPAGDLVVAILVSKVEYVPMPNCWEGCTHYMDDIVGNGKYVQKGYAESSGAIAGWYHDPYKGNPPDLVDNWCATVTGANHTTPCDGYQNLMFKIIGVKYPAGGPTVTAP